MITFGFSYLGLIYLIMLVVPGLLYFKIKPADLPNFGVKENKFFLILEKLGQILVSTTLLIFSSNNVHSTVMTLFLIFSVIFMIIYELYWVRYFLGSRTAKDIYRPFCGIRIPGAKLPVFALIFFSIYAQNSILFISAVIFGIGHIAIHTKYDKEVNGEFYKKKVFMIIFYFILSVALFIILIVLGNKNYNQLKHLSVIKNGFEQTEYLDINGQKQFITINGTKKENPVIISLHGGPAGPDSPISYLISDNLINDYTFINWDQRGCGRTYYKNIALDENNETVNFNQAIDDLDKLVDFARKEFNQDKVIILGHSYGTILGSVYVHLYPQKVKCYIGAAQVINTQKADIYSYEDAHKKAEQKGKDTSIMEEYYNNFISDTTLPNMLKLRSVVMPYHMPRVRDKSLVNALISPFLTKKDLSWSLMQIKDLNKYLTLEQKLMEYLIEFNLYNFDMNYECPVYFISGSDDWTCPVDLIKEYTDKISAPAKEVRIIEGYGHSVNYTSPKDFAAEIQELLKESLN